LPREFLTSLSGATQSSSRRCSFLLRELAQSRSARFQAAVRSRCGQLAELSPRACPSNLASFLPVKLRQLHREYPEKLFHAACHHEYVGFSLLWHVGLLILSRWGTLLPSVILLVTHLREVKRLRLGWSRSLLLLTRRLQCQSSRRLSSQSLSLSRSLRLWKLPHRLLLRGLRHSSYRRC
jgi:hypothetical protein